MFGAWFAQVLIQTGIAESVIRSAVELAGDRPLVTAIVINLVTALLFTSHVRRRRGHRDRRHRAADHDEPGHPGARRRADLHHGRSARARTSTWCSSARSRSCFPGIKYEAPWLTFWMIGMAVYLLCAWLMIYFNLRGLGVRKLAAVDAAAAGQPPRKRTPYYTYLVPIVPGGDDHGVQVADHSDLPAEHRAGARC